MIHYFRYLMILNYKDYLFYIDQSAIKERKYLFNEAFGLRKDYLI